MYFWRVTLMREVVAPFSIVAYSVVASNFHRSRTIVKFAPENRHPRFHPLSKFVLPFLMDQLTNYEWPIPILTTITSISSRNPNCTDRRGKPFMYVIGLFPLRIKTNHRRSWNIYHIFSVYSTNFFQIKIVYK